MTTSRDCIYIMLYELWNILIYLTSSSFAYVKSTVLQLYESEMKSLLTGSLLELSGQYIKPVICGTTTERIHP